MRRSRWLVAALALGGLAVPPTTVVVLLSTSNWRGIWSSDGWARPVLVGHILSVAAASFGGAAMLRRPATRRAGVVAIVLGAVFATWWYEALRGPATSWRPVLATLLVYSLRPLLFWLVLAFPVGRLDRSARRLWWLFVAGTVAYLVFESLLDLWPEDPIALWQIAAWTEVLHSIWWDITGLAMALAVLVVVWRRNLRWMASRALVRPAWWAAVVAAGADVVLMGTGPLRDLMTHRGHLTVFGSVIQVIDIARWGVVVAILVVGSRSFATLRSSGDEVELGTGARADEPVPAVLYATAEGWVDASGVVVLGPDDLDADQFTTIVQRGRALAAVRHDPIAHPAVLDSAAAVVALGVAQRRALALARSRELRLRQLGRVVLEAEDDARRALERDIHDGAQQALVGLVIEAALAEKMRDPAAAADLAVRIDGVIGDLDALATGECPPLVASRGLGAGLDALAATAPVPVRAAVRQCDHLSAPAERMLWFAASDAMANALKHAGASRLSIDLDCDGHAAVLVVSDDGVGGMSAAPASLTERVRRSGGTLSVVSPHGGGTEIRVEVPCNAEVTP